MSSSPRGTDGRHDPTGYRSVVRSPVQGLVVAVDVRPGQALTAGQTLLVLESMKMEIPVVAPGPWRVRSLAVAVGDTVAEGDVVAEGEVVTLAGTPAAAAGEPVPGDDDVDSIAGTSDTAPSLAALRAREALLADAARPQAVGRRHAGGRMTAREHVAALLDPDSFTEYGALAVAAQRSRRPLEVLQRETPADGLIAGTGRAGGRPVAVLAYDYTVLAGTQGVFNHQKADRLLEIAERLRLPVVLWAEGGGGRPGDVDWLGVAGLDCTTFARFASLSGVVPLVGIGAGFCFAGNAALLGCCDIVIATEGSSLGMGGPAMIEGGGLGRVAPQDVGPVAALAVAGAVDCVVPDDRAATALARRLLGLLDGGGSSGNAHTRDPIGSIGSAAGAGTPPVDATPGGDAMGLRTAIPSRRQTTYDVQPILRTVFDADSWVELRAANGRAVCTGLARLGGRPVAVAASQVTHGAGALDAPACDKLARLMQLADVHDLPLVTFVDTPGFMVGPASEATGMLRHAARLFVTASALRVPVASVVLRRGYGLGAMALTAGHFHAPVATAAWPGGEFGAMGLEGAVRLGFRKELEAEPEATRDALFMRLLADAMTRGQALNMASHLEIDAVIDPADTRPWLMRVLASAEGRPRGPRRAFVDPC